MRLRKFMRVAGWRRSAWPSLAAKAEAGREAPSGSSPAGMVCRVVSWFGLTPTTSQVLSTSMTTTLWRAPSGRAATCEQVAAAALHQPGAPGQPGRGQDGRHHQHQADDDAQQGGFGHDGLPAGQRRLFRRLMRSDGVMMSVRRMPYLSSTTTTSPWAIR